MLLMAVPGAWISCCPCSRPYVSLPGPHQTQRAWEGPSLLCVVSPEAFGDALGERLLVFVERILYLGTEGSRLKSVHFTLGKSLGSLQCSKVSLACSWAEVKALHRCEGVLTVS